MTNILESLVEIEEPRPIRVVNVIGTPGTVESQVNRYIKQGYALGSSLLPWIEPNTHVHLFVQQVVLYEENQDVDVTTRREN